MIGNKFVLSHFAKVTIDYLKDVQAVSKKFSSEIETSRSW